MLESAALESHRFLSAGTDSGQQDLRATISQPSHRSYTALRAEERGFRRGPEAFPPTGRNPRLPRGCCATPGTELTPSRSSEQMHTFTVASQALSCLTWTSGAPQRNQAEGVPTCQWTMLIPGSLLQRSLLRGSGHGNYQLGPFGGATCLPSPAEVTTFQHLEACAPLGGFTST